MKLGFLLNILLFASLILAQEEMEGMEDSEEMEDEEEDNTMMSMGMQGGMGMPSNQNDTMKEMDRRKKNKGLKDLYVAAMLVKSLISTMLSFVSPVMQVKGFGLSVINTILNVARFLIDMRRMMPMIRNVMSGWADRSDPPQPVRPTIQANRKTIQVPDYLAAHKFYKPQFVPERHLYPPMVKPLNSIYLPATTYAPHRSPFRHYYTRNNKDLTTPTSQWSQHDDSNNYIQKSLEVSPTLISLATAKGTILSTSATS